jgi:hypothetical protein
MTPLLAPQSEAIIRLHTLKVGALFMRPGVGKTRPAVELIRSVPDIDHIIWLAPFRSVNPDIAGTGIQDEVAKWGGFHVPVTFIGIESISSADKLYLRLVNLVNRYNCFLVCDESLKIKNFTAKRTRRIIELSRHCEYKLILNGTPISRNLLDLWAQFEFLSPKILRMDQNQYKASYCESVKITKHFGHRRTPYTREFITAFHNIDHLYSIISPYVYEADLHLDVKEQHIDLDFSIDEETMAEYQRIKAKYLDNEKLMWMKNNIFLELTQKMQHLYCCTPDKFTVLNELFKVIEPEKTIIFTKYIASAEACRKAFPKATVLSIQANSYSLNLQAFHNTIYWDKTWDFAVIDQSQHRTRRTGQQHDLRFYTLHGNVPLEKLITDNNDKKQGMLQYLKGKTKEQIKADL